MTQPRIRRAFEVALAGYAAGHVPALPVAWENVELVPQPAGPYLRANLLPAGTFSSDLERKHRRYQGIFQIGIVIPTGGGSAAAEAIAGELAALFAPSVPTVVGGLTVWAAEPLSQAPAVPEGDRYLIPCSVPYLAHEFIA